MRSLLASYSSLLLLALTLPGPSLRAQGVQFIRADSNSSVTVDISDAIFTLGCLFTGTACAPCADAADANDDGRLDLSDAVYTLNFLFGGGPRPQPPYPSSGYDPTTADASKCGDAPPSADPGDVVISEIHYHPQSEDPDDEFIELYNSTARRIDLGGWRFSEGVDLAILDGAIDPASYLVIARDPARIAERYGIANLLEQGYLGQLDDGGETLRLKDAAGNTINKVRYDDGGGLWPRWADGYGSSLELIDLHGETDSYQAWQASDEFSQSEWTPFQITQTTSASSSELHILLLSQGECLVDNLQVLVGGQNRLANGSFENNMTGWLAQGTHRLSRVTTAAAVQGTRALHLVATGRGDTASNRIECELTSAVGGGQSVSIRGSARWVRGAHFLLVRLHGNAVAGSVALAVPEAAGTPGGPNSAGDSNRGPDIESVIHSPILPGATQTVRITCRPSDVDGVASVSLRYRVDTGAETTRSMGDDGQNGDTTAGDGVYSANISAQASGRMVAFWIAAVDALGAEARFPSDAPGRTCLYRTGEPNPTSQLDRYHVWMAAATVNALSNAPKMSNEMVDITFVLNNTEVFYNAQLRYRGSPFIRPGPPTDPVGGRYAYRIDFSEQHPLLGRTEINLDNLEPGRDPTLQREKTAYVFCKELGLPYSEMNYVRFWINGNDHGVYADVEKIDNDFVDAHWPEDTGGELLKVDDYFEFDDNFGFSNRDAHLTDYGARKEEYRWNYEKRDTDRNDDFAPIQTLSRLMNTSGAAYETNVEQAINPEQWAKTLAVRKIIGDWDSFGYNRGKNMYLYRPPLEGRWHLINWDMDFLLGSGDGPSTPLYGGIDAAVNTFLNHPKYKRLYLKAFRDLVNGSFRNPFIDPILNQTYDVLRRETAVQDPGAIKSYITQRRNYVLSQLPSDQVIILTNNGNDFSTSAASVTIEGDAPLEVERFRLNGAPVSMTITGISKWSFTRSIPLGLTAFTIEGLDAGNALIGSDSISIRRVVPCVPSAVEPSTTPPAVVTLTIRGSGFAPGTTPAVRLASASTEVGFRAFYAQAGGGFGDVDAAAAFLSNPAGAVRQLSTSHVTVSRRTEGGDEIFPTQPFPAPWNTGAVSNLAARYTGFIHAPSAGTRTLGVHSDDGFRLRINGVVVAEYPPPRAPATTTGTFNFPAAGSYPIQLDWYENGGGDIVQLFQETTGGTRRLINDGSELAVTLDDPIIIEGSGVTVLDENTISADFDLTAAESGPWSLEMVPVEGSPCRREGALVVE